MSDRLKPIRRPRVLLLGFLAAAVLAVTLLAGVRTADAHNTGNHTPGDGICTPAEGNAGKGFKPEKPNGQSLSNPHTDSRPDCTIN